MNYKTSSTAVLKDISILYVEHDLDIVQEVQTFLETKVKLLAIARNTEAGYVLYKKIKPDLIIADIEVGKLDGLELIQRIREENHFVPIIVTSTFDDAKVLIKAIDLGIDAYLTKPFSLYKLLEKLKRACQPRLLKQLVETKKKLLLYKERVDFAFEATQEGLWEWNIQTDEVYFSPRWKEILGYHDNEFENSYYAWEKSIHPADLAKIKKKREEIFSQGQKRMRIKYRQIDKFGIARWILSRGTIEYDADGLAMRMIGTHLDITEKKRKYEDSLKNQKLLESAADLAGLAYWELDFTTNTFIFNDAYYKFLGTNAQDEGGYTMNVYKYLPNFIPSQSQEIIVTALQDAFLQNKEYKSTFEYTMVKRDGAIINVLVDYYVTYDENENPFKAYGTMYNMTRQKDYEKELKRARDDAQLLSITDGLTELYNRRFFDEVIVKELNRSKRDKKNLAFLMLDIDNFKLYNDTYGHTKGDATLKAVASVLKNYSARSEDTAFRLGGEEFGIIFLPESSSKTVSYANSLLHSVENLHIKHEKNDASNFLTVSIGLIFKSYEYDMTAEEIYQKADKALYYSKSSGRNQVKVYTF